MTKEADHNAREQLFTLKKDQLLRSAAEFLTSAAWLTSEFTDVVQRPNIEAAKDHIEQGEWEEARKYNGESWYSRLSSEDYAVLREVADMVIRLSPDIAVDSAVKFLQDDYSSAYFELRLSEAGYKKISFKKP